MTDDLRAQVTMAVASICRPHPAYEPVPDEPAIVEAVMDIFEPRSPLPPGVELARVLKAMGLSQLRLARATGLTTKHVNQVISGAAALSYETAIRLEDVTGVPASWWNAAEAAYRTAQLRAVRDSWRSPIPAREALR